MTNKNYLSLIDKYRMQIYGFERLSETAYVSVGASGKSVIIEPYPVSQRDSTFKIYIDRSKNTVEDERLYHILNHYQLFQTNFIYHEDTDSYYGALAIV